MSGGVSKAGWSPEPAVTHSEIVDPLYGLDADDPHLPDTWKYRDRYCTGSEQFLILTASDAAWDDAFNLCAIDRERAQADLEWLRFIVTALTDTDEDTP
jgi:hypothetical protein